MLSVGKMVVRYLKYSFEAKDEHDLHSPFLFALYTQAIKKGSPRQPVYVEVEKVRKQLLDSSEKINFLDLGAKQKSGERMVRTVAKRSAKPKKYGQLIYRLVDFLKPQICLELGTSLGLTTQYIAKGNSTGSVFSLEGCPETAALAKRYFEQEGISNIYQEVGDFSQTLPKVLENVQKVDFVFFDGNHQKQQTLDYFHTVLPFIHEKTWVIFDDIHWSEGMEEAWSEIKQHPQVRVTIDLFAVGIVFFDSSLSKQDYILTY